ncbi:MAG: 5-methyltetrahydropteroyltriglutamate--homocysteine S-methyltransferase [Trueperaceae bacterium]|nr:5-methyltetrahydropteroyltriglutamate--homocysteine S-methyltransferase [Trueperaceae bacterium]
MSITVSNLGFPRIGRRRELKRALEGYWSGKHGADELMSAAAALRAANWREQAAAGVRVIPSNDFSLYDQMLDTSAMVGAVPQIYGWRGGSVDLDTYFAMARGTRGRQGGDLPALEMTKWFDTNYHYLVPAFESDQRFELSSTKVVDEFLEAKDLGIHTRPVLVGPVSYLLLGKSQDPEQDTLSLLPRLLPVYAEVLRSLAAAGADWVQLDEPCLVLDLSSEAKHAFAEAYRELAEVADLKLLVATYFGSLGDNLETAVSLPVAGLHLDLVRAPNQLREVLASAPKRLKLSLGVIDGRNVWRADLVEILDRLEPVLAEHGADRFLLAPSCSLLHVPIDLVHETDLDPELRGWLAFAAQKLEELAVLGRALSEGRSAAATELAASAAAAAGRRSSPKVHDPVVAARLGALTPDLEQRNSPYARRREAQRARFPLPAYPTTTIGSFPQTQEVRKARAANAKGQLSDADYLAYLRRETEAAVRWQEEIGIDVLVHGEFERNDMVQYFGEQLAGYAFTQHAWVQSYGSRYVRPPIIFGDVSRLAPMTVEWSAYAQSLTSKPLKGMLTGPVTMLQWSFVRDDQPRERTCRQIALALRDEVTDLETAGIGIVQVDEPALREGLPLRRADWPAYLDWAVACFRLATAGTKDETQVHTHMCYSEFGDILGAISAMDADVISIENARSKAELLEAFKVHGYPNEIGPGVYDIHAPRTPPVEEIVELLREAGAGLSVDQLWVNPDCGLKTRSWDEVRPALVNLVEAARRLRAQS